MSARFPERVDEYLRAAGWTPGRVVPLPPDLPPDFVLFPRAAEVLQEFGGLHIGSVGPGEQRARSDVLLRPGVAAELSANTGHVTKEGTKLYPLGELHHGHALLLIDELGRIYTYFDELELYAMSFDRALSQLVLGTKSEPDSSPGENNNAG